MSKKNNAENILSKAGTAIKSAAEYAFFEGVGKTAKNFAGCVSSGAKQGYGYFTTDINMHSAVEDTFQKVERLANISAISEKNYYQTLAPKEKFEHLIMECASKYATLKNSNDQNTLLQGLEVIVQNQIKNWSVLTLGNQYNNSLTKKSYTDLAPEAKLNELTRISKEIFNKMHDERAKQPEFIATTHKIERLKEDLTNLAEASGVKNGAPYNNAQTYEEKIDLIRIALNAKQKQLDSDSEVQSLKQKVQAIKTHKLHSDQALSSNDLMALIQEGEELHKKQEDKAAVDLQIQRLETAKQTLTDLRSAEAELLHPKQHRVVRTLKTAAGLIAGATIGALTGSGAAIKTAAKAIKQAPSGIRDTYRKNRSNNQKSR